MRTRPIRWLITPIDVAPRGKGLIGYPLLAWPGITATADERYLKQGLTVSFFFLPERTIAATQPDV
jgi:hypothetical protein